MIRRTFIATAALALAVTIGACSGNEAAAVAEGDIATGAPEGAKVTVVEYASVTCGACAAWQQQVYPAFKAKYIDTNKIRFVFREYPTGPVEVAAAGFLMARCAGEDKYLDVVHELMASQPEMLGGGNPRTVLLRVANGAGLTEQQFTQCVTNPENIAALEARTRAADDAGVGGTPTFLVNGVTTGRSLEELSAAIDAELAK